MLDKNKKYVSEENLKDYTKVLNQKYTAQTIRIDSDIKSNTNLINKEINRAKGKEQDLGDSIYQEQHSRILEINRVESDYKNAISDLDNNLQLLIHDQINTLQSNVTTNFQTSDANIELKISNHIKDQNNPHRITSDQIGAASAIQFESLKSVVDAQVENIEELEQLQAQNKNSIDSLNTNVANKVNLYSETKQSIVSDVIIDKNLGKGIKGNLTVKGNLIVEGAHTVVNTETLQVKDNFIFVNSDGEDLSTSLAGIAIRTNSQKAYGIAYDINNDSVSLGAGTVSNGQFNFDSGERKPILTRDVSANIRDGSILVWDSEKNIAKDGGIIDVEGLKKQFVPLNLHYSLEDRVEEVEKSSNDHVQNFNNPHRVSWAQINSDALNDSITPTMNGVANVGSSSKVSRADHIHPVDTSRAPIDHSSASTLYGKATTTKYGHVIVDEIINDFSENPVQSKVIKHYIDSSIQGMDFSELSLTQSETISIINQTDGKINVQKQSIQIKQAQVDGLISNLENINSNINKLQGDLQDESLARSTGDSLLSQSINEARSDLTDMIDDNRDRIVSVETTVETVKSINDSIQDIQQQISNGEYSYDQLWVLSFNSEVDGFGNVSYIPYFTSIDDGELS